MTARISAASTRALRLWLRGGITKSAACRKVGVSRMTLDRAIKRNNERKAT